MKVGFDPVGIKSIQSTFNANDGNAWESHLQAKSARKSRTTTRRNPAHLPAPDLLQRDFTTQRPNQIWLADITYIPTQEGGLYLAAILDLYSPPNRGLGDESAFHGDPDVGGAHHGPGTAPPDQMLLHHSDQGRQCTSGAYQQLLKDHAVQLSVRHFA